MVFGPIYRSMAKVAVRHLGQFVQLPTMTYLRFVWERLAEDDIGAAVYYLDKASSNVINQVEHESFALAVEGILSAIEAHAAALRRDAEAEPSMVELSNERTKLLRLLGELEAKVRYIGRPVLTQYPDDT